MTDDFGGRVDSTRPPEACEQENGLNENADCFAQPLGPRAHAQDTIGE
jgi:hypothetical protein